MQLVNRVCLTAPSGLISSCVRLAVFTRNYVDIDPTWRSVTLGTWTDIESSVYLIAACLPSLRPLVRAIAHPKILKNNHRSKDTHFTLDEHTRSKSSARISFSGANRFWRLSGEHREISEAERGQHSVRAVSRADATHDDSVELAQVTGNGQIRVTNAIQVDYESNEAHPHGREIADKR